MFMNLLLFLILYNFFCKKSCYFTGVKFNIHSNSLNILLIRVYYNPNQDIDVYIF